jgi:hypothetical protein
MSGTRTLIKNAIKNSLILFMLCNENACGIRSEFASVNNEPNDGL